MNPNIQIKNPNDIRDKESIIKHIKTSKMVSHLQYIPENLKEDRDIFKEATKIYHGSILFASDKLAKDREFALELFQINPKSFVCLHKDLINDVSLILDVVSLSKEKASTIAMCLDVAEPPIKNSIKGVAVLSDIITVLEKCSQMQKDNVEIFDAPFESQYQAYLLSKELKSNLKPSTKLSKI